LAAVPWRAVIAWVLVAPCVAWVVIRVFGLERGYPMVALLALTPLVVVGAALVAVAAALLQQRAAAVVAALAALALGGLVAPRALGGPAEADGPRLRILTLNLHMQPRAADAVVALVRRTQPDVLSLQELTPQLAGELERQGLDELLTHSVVEARPGPFGLALFGRMPLEPLGPPRGQAVVAARARIAGAPPLELYAVHTRAPVSAGNVGAWKADLRALPSAAPTGAVRILAGDFNATLDHAELRRVIDGGYEDAADELGDGLRGTWPANRRFPPPVTIDHVLADARCGARSLETIDIPGSDHRAVLVELALP
jgi:endonuclease/exonuclease/phosphatase (EEP) superfamily protein YafD